MLSTLELNMNTNIHINVKPNTDISELSDMLTSRSIPNCTTGFSFFAKCLTHSAKADIHSTKPLSSVTLGKERSVNNLSAKTSLPSVFYWALDKAFAEC